MEIPYREFVRNFRKYKKTHNAAILGRHRCVIGYWNGVEEKVVVVPVEQKEPLKRKGLVVLAENGVGMKPIFETKTIPTCMKCGKFAIGEFEQYDWDTGEAKSFDLCKKCSKGFTKKL